VVDRSHAAPDSSNILVVDEEINDVSGQWRNALVMSKAQVSSLVAIAFEEGKRAQTARIN